MWVILTSLLLATVATAQYNDFYEGEPAIPLDNTHFVDRITSYLECPPRAVCGVVFDFNRTRFGVKRPERRVIRRCQCPDGDCPIDPEHRLFSSIKKREYLCNPVERLPRCPRRYSRGNAHMEMIMADEMFDYFNYERINCLCPRHSRPVVPRSRRRMELATVIVGVYTDVPTHRRIQSRRCVHDD